MELAALIARFGYLAVFAGALLEGETVLLLAGYAAHRGYLDPVAVAAVAWSGSTLGDQFYFWLGRRHASRLLARHPRMQSRIDRALAWIARHPDLSIFGMRFMWGLRTALPIALGMSGVSRRRFFWINLLSAALWAGLVTAAGWLFGAAITAHAAEWHRYEHWAIAALLVLALGIALVRHARMRRNGRKTGS